MAVTTDELTIVRGTGAELWSDDGRRFIDCVGGQGSANIGHAHPAVVAAIQHQATQLLSCTNIFANDRRNELLERLRQVTPTGIDSFFLCNSGTEAIEAAIKAALLATGRRGIIAARRSFHGRTLGALATTWERTYREPFAPYSLPVTFVPYNDLEALAAALDESIALVLLEPVQGEGGVHPADPGYLRGAADLAHQHGALLALDEIQTGFGRTGAFFACQHDDVVPDLLCMAKSIAGGLPMGALGYGPAFNGFPPGTHGSTFGGNPLVCAAAVATIDVLCQENLAACAAEQGSYLLQRLQELDLAQVRVVRGRGLLIGLELREKARPVIRALRDHGVLALTAGLSVLRLLPPLVITRSQCDEVVEAIAAALASPR